MDGTLENNVQLLIDHQEIEQVLKLYCRAIDRLDVELLKSIYHPDGTDDHGSFVGNAQEFATHIMGDLQGARPRRHAHGDPLRYRGRRQLRDLGILLLGISALPRRTQQVAAFFGESLCRCPSPARGALEGEHDFFCGGRYIDLFEKRAGNGRFCDGRSRMSGTSSSRPIALRQKAIFPPSISRAGATSNIRLINPGSVGPLRADPPDQGAQNRRM